MANSAFATILALSLFLHLSRISLLCSRSAWQLWQLLQFVSLYAELEKLSSNLNLPLPRPTPLALCKTRRATGRGQIWQRQRQMKLLKPHYNGAKQSETDGKCSPRRGEVRKGGGGMVFSWQCNSSNVKMHSENQQPKIRGINQTHTEQRNVTQQLTRQSRKPEKSPLPLSLYFSLAPTELKNF